MNETADGTYRGVLIYDGDCPFCSAASTALRQLDDVGAIEHDHEAARAFLEAQFGEAPFALFFVDVEDERVRAGREAARELCERAGMPVLVQDVVGDNYETIADAVRTVTGVDREPDPYHGTFPVTPAAAEAYVDLEADARQTHRAAVEARRRRPTEDRRQAGPGRGSADRNGGSERTRDASPSTSRRRTDADGR